MQNCSTAGRDKRCATPSLSPTAPGMSSSTCAVQSQERLQDAVGVAGVIMGDTVQGWAELQ